MKTRIMVGDALRRLRDLPEQSVHCVVTSPPYWGLRAYGGDAGMIGLEPTLDEHLDNLVAVFREVRRVLRRDGVLFLNYGDSYATNMKGTGGATPKQASNAGSFIKGGHRLDHGYKPKDLMGLPWRVAFALQDSGWWVRSEIVWAKKNCMPESAQDRPTSAHEKLFLLTKSGASTFWTHAEGLPGVRSQPAPDYRWTHKETGAVVSVEPENWPGTWDRRNMWKGHDYFYDADAVRVPLAVPLHHPGNKKLDASRNDHDRTEKTWGSTVGANLRNVWSIDEDEYQQFLEWKAARAGEQTDVWRLATYAFPGAHFATFPPALVEPCIKAGTSERGVCGECGAPWSRKAKVTYTNPGSRSTNGPRSLAQRHEAPSFDQRLEKETETLGWHPTCDCTAVVRPSIVLDPFGGAGTTALVANRLGRDGLLIELNSEYAEMAADRIRKDAPLLFTVEVDYVEARSDHA